MPIAVFWDIDGTLLSTHRSGVYALESAMKEVAGKIVDLQALPTAGLTDVEIARVILEEAKVDAGMENVARFLRAYEDDLPRCLPMKKGEVFENIVPILESFVEDERFYSILLTGNTHRGALAKLTHFGLAKYFDFAASAFSDQTDTREDVARLALMKTHEALGAENVSKCFVVGDTTHDIRCANAINAPTIAVATGGCSRKQLEDYGAWRVFDCLPAPDAFKSLLLSS